MTTITIERAVLLRALEALRPATAPNGAKRDAAFEELRAALAAPTTAPEKCGHCGRRTIDPPWRIKPATAPSWQDAPTCAGLWANSVNWRVHKVLEETLGAYQDTNARWFGPIPKDKP